MINHLSSIFAVSLSARVVVEVSAGEFLGVLTCVLCGTGDPSPLTAELLLRSLSLGLGGVRLGGVCCAGPRPVLLRSLSPLVAPLSGDEAAGALRCRCRVCSVRGALDELMTRLI